VYSEFGRSRERWVLPTVSACRLRKVREGERKETLPSPKSISLARKSSISSFLSSNVTERETNAGTPSGRGIPFFILTFKTLRLGSEKSLPTTSVSVNVENSGSARTKLDKSRSVRVSASVTQKAGEQQTHHHEKCPSSEGIPRPERTA